MRRTGVAASLTLALLWVAAPARAAGLVLVIGLPEQEARAFLASRPAAVGLGVYPDSRDASAFVEEIGRGAPPGREGIRSPLGGAPGALRRALESAGGEVRVVVAPSSMDTGAEEIASAFAAPGAPDPTTDVATAPAAPVLVVALRTAEEAAAFVPRGPWRTPIVVGIGRRTPVVVGIVGQAGWLTGGIARRPGVLTPYDVAATVLAQAGVARPDGFIGKALRVEARADALAASDRLAARLERDASFGFAFTAAAVALALGSLVLALAFAAAGAGDTALRMIQGAALVPAGYLAGLFVQNGRAEVRALALVAMFFAGALVPPIRRRAFCGWALVAAAGGVALLTLAAAARPGGEPALSLWGDPLVSWRFFGLRNHLAAFVTGGLLVGGGLLGWRVRPWAIGGIAAAVIVGAAPLGANFVGVLTLAFGAALAVLWRWRARFHAWQFPAAAAIAVGAFALALLADTGSPASHGGIAVRRVASGGLGAAVDFVRVRARLNYAEMRDFAGGFVWVVLIVAFLAGCIVWAARRREDPALRAGLAGAAAAALAALALEDSGFFTAADLGLFPAIAATLLAVERLSGLRSRPARTPSGPPATRATPGAPPPGAS